MSNSVTVRGGGRRRFTDRSVGRVGTPRWEGCTFRIALEDYHGNHLERCTATDISANRQKNFFGTCLGRLLVSRKVLRPC